MDQSTRNELERKARLVRRMTLETIANLGIGHIGGSLSIVELLIVLYYKQMNIDPKKPRMEQRDWFVLSKGHAGPALYSVLADRGFFHPDWLKTLNQVGTNLPSHADRNRTPGIDMTTGSLGQGLSAAIGIALGLRMEGKESFVFACIGDGESQEGQIWEAAMAAPHFKLGRLIAFTDFNKMQIDGMTADIMGLEDIAAKWSAFNWHVQRIDGHDVGAIDQAIEAAKLVEDRPSMIIMDTVKGKGAAFAENNLANHNMPIDRETADAAIRALEEQESN
jgi:transketolase